MPPPSWAGSPADPKALLTPGKVNKASRAPEDEQHQSRYQSNFNSGQQASQAGFTFDTAPQHPGLPPFGQPIPYVGQYNGEQAMQSGYEQGNNGMLLSGAESRLDTQCGSSSHPLSPTASKRPASPPVAHGMFTATGAPSVQGWHDQHKGLQQRQDARPNKRLKSTSEEEEDVPQAGKGGRNPFSSGNNSLTEDLRESQKKAAEERARRAPANAIDLTNDDDDDIIVVSERLDEEVCLGKFQCRVNAHLVPCPKTSSLSTPKNMWPVMKCTLTRRLGSNTSVIGVLDPFNKDFGTIDAVTAIVLAPLMDQSKANKFRTIAKLDYRHRDSFESAHQATSQQMKITITIFAPRRKAVGIGALFSQKGITLMRPTGLPPGMAWVNPHDPQDFMDSKKPGVASTSRYGGTHMGAPKTQEEVRQEVYSIFDNLKQDDDLPEAEPHARITTSLLKHQKQALWFMQNREKPREGHDEYSMWKPETGRNGATSWYNVMTGHSVENEPEPTYGGILADVMGLGKTLNMLSLTASSLDQAVEFAKGNPPSKVYDDDPEGLLFNSRATLLICPLSTVSNWEEQLKAHVKPGGLKYMIYHGSNRPNDPEALRDYDLVITTYPIVSADANRTSAKRPRKPLTEVHWFRIVLDEAHIIREQSTIQSKSVCALSAARRWAVTGTPVQNRLEDLGALFKFLRLRPFEEPHVFTSCVITPFKNADVEVLPKLRLLVDSVTIRRLKDKIDLPERHEHLVHLDMEDGERAFYKYFAEQSFENVKHILAKDKLAGKSFAHVLKTILRLRLLCAAGQDLLSDEDWNVARGFNKATAIDLEDVDTDKTDRSPQQNFELYDMSREMQTNACASCNAFVSTRENIEDEAADDYDSDDDQDVFGYLAQCGQFICVKCYKDFVANCKTRAGPDNFGFCPSCEGYMRLTFFEFKKSEYWANQRARQQLRSNPRMARSLGRYSGPHSKTKALLNDLLDNAKETKAIQAENPDEPPIKSVIFSGWTTHLDLIQIALTSNNIKFVRLDGTMQRKARGFALDAFANDPEVTVILVSIAAGGLGLNLTSASKVYVMEPQYNPAAEAQAVERVHRLGQKRPVTIKKFIMSASFELKMVELQEKKMALAELSMDKNSQKKFDSHDRARRKMEEIRDLFR